VQIKKSIEHATHIRLFHFQLRQHVNEPLKTTLIAVNPEKIDLKTIGER
jgi:hypothetical protein